MHGTNGRPRGLGLELGSELGYKKIREAFDGPPEDEEEQHVAQARLALSQSNGRLNHWEIDFCQSMLHARWPSSRQLTVLQELVWKAQAPKPRAKSGRGRRTGR